MEYELAKNTEAYASIREEWDYMEQALVSISNYPSFPDLGVRSLYGNALMEKKVVGWMLAHYFDSYGKMFTGKHTIGGKSYTFGTDGVLQ